MTYLLERNFAFFTVRTVILMVG